jgi:SNF2 family DNA or RNA helicase
VLALLESRRAQPGDNGHARKPSLVVVPKSLVFNWIEEAQRFTPQLRVLDYTGLDRAGRLEEFDQYDLIVTTYGILRRDIVRLKDVPFDYAILDESQAIKNANSQAAKASRLLRADHRLAMTGTPVENHLGELWSLFEFLNPGMLGRSGAFDSLAKQVRGGDDTAVSTLARGLRPFLLRRTKGQVLTELPAKTEQTLFCEMEPKQRKLYDELREYYRASLSQRVSEIGLKRAKIHVLEALLRLRQAACHPGLIDQQRAGEPSAKLEALLDQIAEVVDEGHKALVFSQFTSLLAIVRQRLDKSGIVYEYLDGQTRQRDVRVKRFQEDAKCPLFLISLKAGGHGLNLTAADYVYILDPWWNPAVEAQAIDRTHRIGQTRRVFAYRLICRDTVEEKILELQREKRELADAIVSADNSLISGLTADDLQMLLS